MGGGGGVITQTPSTKMCLGTILLPPSVGGHEGKGCVTLARRKLPLPSSLRILEKKAQFFFHLRI